MKSLGTEIGFVYDFLADMYPDISSTVVGQVTFICDDKLDYTPVVAFVLEPLGKTVSLIVNEKDDLEGIGRGMKIVLENRGYHVYYVNRDMARVGNAMVIGTELITYMRSKLAKQDVITGISQGTRSNLYVN